jgi:hypothetical protein
MFRIYISLRRIVGTYRQVRFAQLRNDSTVFLEVNVPPELTLRVGIPTSLIDSIIQTITRSPTS